MKCICRTLLPLESCGGNPAPGTQRLVCLPPTHLSLLFRPQEICFLDLNVTLTLVILVFLSCDRFPINGLTSQVAWEEGRGHASACQGLSGH